MIPQFIQQWERGYKNVYGVITRRSDESATRKFLTRGFYRLINALSDRPIPENASDFRLVDRVAYQALNKMRERNRMLRTMWVWIGFSSIGVEHERAPRFGGKSTYALFRNIRFALNGILASSVAPLKFIPFFGLALSALSFIGLLCAATVWIRYGVPFAGFGTIIALILLMFGVLFFFLGVISEYIGLTLEEVRRRPSFIIEAESGFGHDESIRSLTLQPAEASISTYADT